MLVFHRHWKIPMIPEVLRLLASLQREPNADPFQHGVVFITQAEISNDCVGPLRALPTPLRIKTPLNMLSVNQKTS